MSLLDVGPIELSVALHHLPDPVLITNLSHHPPVNVKDTIDIILLAGTRNSPMV